MDHVDIQKQSIIKGKRSRLFKSDFLLVGLGSADAMSQ